jgi:hypothetical protein
MRRGFLKSFVLVSVIVLLLSSSLNVTFTGSNQNVAKSAKSEYYWSIGDTFPMVDGHKIFPPTGPTISKTSGAPLWYAGSVSSWVSNRSARTIGMTIRIPYSTPRPDEFYYVLLSAFDSAGSYDQIGFSNDYGTWGLAYSWTTGPVNNLTFHYTSNALALSLGATYTFNITTQSGISSFACYKGSSQIWSSNASTGGDFLVLSRYNPLFPSYTDYEEIWNTSISGGSPAFDFLFSNNYWVSVYGPINAVTDWTTYFSKEAPEGVAVTISSSDVLVHNPNASPTPTPTAPEYPLMIIAVTSFVTVSIAVLIYNRKHVETKRVPWHGACNDRKNRYRD